MVLHDATVSTQITIERWEGGVLWTESEDLPLYGMADVSRVEETDDDICREDRLWCRLCCMTLYGFYVSVCFVCDTPSNK